MILLKSFVAPILFFFLSGCESGIVSDDVVQVPDMEIRDSSGIRIVEAGLSYSPLEKHEFLVAGDTLLNAADPLFESITGLTMVQPLGDSVLVALSESSTDMLFFRYDSSGNTSSYKIPAGSDISSVRATALLPYSQDTLLAWEAPNRRISAITLNGIHSWKMRDDIPRLTVAGALGDGSIIGVYTPPLEQQDAGLTRAPGYILRLDRDESSVDTVHIYRGTERIVQREHQSSGFPNRPARSGSVAFGRSTLWTIGKESLLFLDTEACEIDRLNRDGQLTMRLMFHCSIELVSESDKEEFIGSLVSPARSRSDSIFRRRMAERSSFASSKPTASGLFTDRYDRIWLRLPVSSPEEDWTWWVFDFDGSPITRFGLSRQWRIVSVDSNAMIVIQTDRDDALPVVARMQLPELLQVN